MLNRSGKVDRRSVNRTEPRDRWRDGRGDRALTRDFLSRCSRRNHNGVDYTFGRKLARITYLAIITMIITIIIVVIRAISRGGRASCERARAGQGFLASSSTRSTTRANPSSRTLSFSLFHSLSLLYLQYIKSTARRTCLNLKH